MNNDARSHSQRELAKRAAAARWAHRPDILSEVVLTPAADEAWQVAGWQFLERVEQLDPKAEVGEECAFENPDGSLTLRLTVGKRVFRHKVAPGLWQRRELGDSPGS